MLEDIGVTGQKFILVFFRTASVLWLLPIFSARSISVPFKMGVSILIAFLMVDFVSLGSVTFSDPFHMMLLVLKEIFIGVTIGYVVRLIFTMVQVAGEMVSLQAGFGFARFMDPYTNTQVSELTQILNILTLMVFFAIDAHHFVLKGLFASFKELPLAGAGMKGPLVGYLIDITGKVFSVGLKIGAPLIITLFLVELSLGILSRMIPQINVFVEGMPLKILITISVLSFSIAILVPAIAGLFRGIDGEFLRTIRHMV
jgi:flagellar biosynthesis protein FliR